MIAVGGISGGAGSVIGGGSFLDGFKQGLITSSLNHVVHLAIEGGDPPKVGDICIDECGQIQEFDGKGWITWKPKITGIGQILSTDSPIEWVLGAWKTPFQAADDLAILGLAKIGGGGTGWK
jgi:hypothetical protein